MRAFDALIEHTAGSARIYCEGGEVQVRYPFHLGPELEAETDGE